uniref:Uncharacterized protein n=1 Tax=Ditylum brightwellii TaxID=49249 RepID=A0A7S4VZY2_9STRA|mmetsp:Transcript_10335/g.15285  ORF Transcript_10335/g.15285 Transcript_10335/m.15285 type:complete len:1347 (+) Transcript_10335:1222-5262(+)
MSNHNDQHSSFRVQYGKQKDVADWEKHLGSIIERTNRNFSHLHQKIGANSSSGERSYSRSFVPPPPPKHLPNEDDRRRNVDTFQSAHHGSCVVATRSIPKHVEDDITRKIEIRTKRSVQKMVEDKIAANQRTFETLREKNNEMVEAVDTMKGGIDWLKKSVTSQDKLVEGLREEVHVRRALWTQMERFLLDEEGGEEWRRNTKYELKQIKDRLEQHQLETKMIGKDIDEEMKKSAMEMAHMAASSAVSSALLPVQTGWEREKVVMQEEVARLRDEMKKTLENQQTQNEYVRNMITSGLSAHKMEVEKTIHQLMENENRRLFDEITSSLRSEVIRICQHYHHEQQEQQKQAKSNSQSLLEDTKTIDVISGIVMRSISEVEDKMKRNIETSLLNQFSQEVEKNRRSVISEIPNEVNRMRYEILGTIDQRQEERLSRFNDQLKVQVSGYSSELKREMVDSIVPDTIKRLTPQTKLELSHQLDCAKSEIASATRDQVYRYIEEKIGSLSPHEINREVSSTAKTVDEHALMIDDLKKKIMGSDNSPREQTGQIENWRSEVNAVMQGSIKSTREIKNADLMNLSRDIDMKLTRRLDLFKQNVDTEISETDTKWTSKFADVSKKINNTQNLCDTLSESVKCVRKLKDRLDILESCQENGSPSRSTETGHQRFLQDQMKTTERLGQQIETLSSSLESKLSDVKRHMDINIDRMKHDVAKNKPYIDGIKSELYCEMCDQSKKLWAGLSSLSEEVRGNAVTLSKQRALQDVDANRKKDFNTTKPDNQNNTVEPKESSNPDLMTDKNEKDLYKIYASNGQTHKYSTNEINVRNEILTQNTSHNNNKTKEDAEKKGTISIGHIGLQEGGSNKTENKNINVASTSAISGGIPLNKGGNHIEQLRKPSDSQTAIYLDSIRSGIRDTEEGLRASKNPKQKTTFETNKVVKQMGSLCIESELGFDINEISMIDGPDNSLIQFPDQSSNIGKVGCTAVADHVKTADGPQRFNQIGTKSYVGGRQKENDYSGAKRKDENIIGSDEIPLDNVSSFDEGESFDSSTVDGEDRSTQGKMQNDGPFSTKNIPKKGESPINAAMNLSSYLSGPIGGDEAPKQNQKFDLSSNSEIASKDNDQRTTEDQSLLQPLPEADESALTEKEIPFRVDENKNKVVNTSKTSRSKDTGGSSSLMFEDGGTLMDSILSFDEDESLDTLPSQKDEKSQQDVIEYSCSTKDNALLKKDTNEQNQRKANGPLNNTANAGMEPSMSSFELAESDKAPMSNVGTEQISIGKINDGMALTTKKSRQIFQEDDDHHAPADRSIISYEDKLLVPSFDRSSSRSKEKTISSYYDSDFDSDMESRLSF